MPQAPVLEVRDLRFGPLSVTELRYDAPNYGQSDPIPACDAVMVSLQLRPNPKHDVWEDGKKLPTTPVMRGMTCIYDLRRAVTAESEHPFHCINFAFPLLALDDSGEDRLDRMSFDAAARLSFHDPVIESLGGALVPALDQPENASRLFVDHVLFAMRAHVAQRFGVAAAMSVRLGGLAARQERRAKAFIDAHLSENISLAELARECSLSVAQFARAFKRSTGVPPYQFLTERRIERARELLQHTALPLADVAIRCGFADQSHFTKVFRRVAGVSPGSFRATSRAMPAS